MGIKHVTQTTQAMHKTSTIGLLLVLVCILLQVTQHSCVLLRGISANPTTITTTTTTTQHTSSSSARRHKLSHSLSPINVLGVGFVEVGSTVRGLNNADDDWSGEVSNSEAEHGEDGGMRGGGAGGKFIGDPKDQGGDLDPESDSMYEEPITHTNEHVMHHRSTHNNNKINNQLQFDDPSTLTSSPPSSAPFLHFHMQVGGSNTEKYNRKSGGKETSAHQSQSKKKKAKDKSIEPKPSTGFEKADPAGPNDNRSPDNDMYDVKFAGAPFKNRNNYTGRFEWPYRGQVPTNVRVGGPMEGEGYDLINKFYVDETEISRPVGRAVQRFGVVYDAPPEGMGLPADEPPEEPPPRATEAAEVAEDKPPPPKNAVSDPVTVVPPAYPFVTIDPPLIPDPSSIPADVLGVPPNLLKSNDVFEMPSTLVLNNGTALPCPENGTAEDWKKCMGIVLAQLPATECSPSEGGVDNGKLCAFHDFALSKVRGYATGWSFAVKQLVQTYREAYRVGYTEAYDIAFDEGKAKFIGEVAAGADPNSIHPEPVPGLSGPGSGGEQGAVPISTEAKSPDESSSANSQQAKQQQKAEDRRKEDELKQDPVKVDQDRKQQACEQERANKQEEINIKYRGATGPIPQATVDCDTGPGATLQR